MLIWPHACPCWLCFPKPHQTLNPGPWLDSNWSSHSTGFLHCYNVDTHFRFSFSNTFSNLSSFPSPSLISPYVRPRGDLAHHRNLSFCYFIPHSSSSTSRSLSAKLGQWKDVISTTVSQFSHTRLLSVFIWLGKNSKRELYNKFLYQLFYLLNFIAFT